MYDYYFMEMQSKSMCLAYQLITVIIESGQGKELN